MYCVSERMIAYDPYHGIDSCQVRGRDVDGKIVCSRGRKSKEQREEHLRRHRQWHKAWCGGRL